MVAVRRVVPVLVLLCVPTLVKPNEPEEVGKSPKIVLVIHGGAGVLSPAEMAREKIDRKDYEAVLVESLRAGHKMLRQDGKTSTDAVEAAIRVLEDSAMFNAGRGAVFNHDGRVELDAAIMEGRMTIKDKEVAGGKRDPRKRAGAVAGVAHIKNPISAARAVMEMPGGRHVLLTGDGAEWFSLSDENRKRFRLERVSNIYFWTDRELKEIRDAVRPGKTEGAWLPPAKLQAQGPRSARAAFGTVGAVALDRAGNLAAGTSTGGLTDKLPGRVGDSPILGAGTYADDRACGVSCTGTGEVFLRYAVAHDVVARMRYKKLSVEAAAREAIDEMPDEEGGLGGLIALDRTGRAAFPLSARTDGMYRGYVTEDGDLYVAIQASEKLKKVGKAGAGVPEKQP